MVVVSSEGSWVRRDLEHVYVSMKKKRVWTDYIELLKDICRTRIEESEPILGHSFM